MPKSITVEVLVNAPIERTWIYWTEPEHITKWNFAQDDWECPTAANDLRTGGRFTARMQNKNTKEGFDFGGVYTNVIPQRIIEYAMDDNRKVSVAFEHIDGKTKVTETFETESANPEELQRDGWQAILNNFKKYAESRGE